MKRFLSLILAVVMLYSLASVAFTADNGSFGSYQRVVIIGVDGAGAFFDDADTPNMDRIFSENSAVSHNGEAEFPTISAQNWGAMLLGVSADRHKLTNDKMGIEERNSTEKYPSIFRLTREAYPDAVLSSFCNWNPINFGLIENDINVYKDSAVDDVLCTKITDYLAQNDPKLLFVQFDSVDGAGHGKGYGSQEHLNQITTVDEYIGRIYDSLVSLGRLEETLFVVVSDHGGTSGGSHGGATSAEKKIFLGVKGKNVTNGVLQEDIRNRDVAAITLYALGIEQPEIMTSNVPDNMFEGYVYTPRPLGDSSMKQFLDFMEIVQKYLPLLLTAVNAIINAAV